MKNDTLAFLAGIGVGVVAFFWVLVLLGPTPRAVYRKYTTEAVQLGYGRWVVDTNKFGDKWSPETKFEWITNRTENR